MAHGGIAQLCGSVMYEVLHHPYPQGYYFYKVNNEWKCSHLEPTREAYVFLQPYLLKDIVEKANNGIGYAAKMLKDIVRQQYDRATE